MGPANLAYIIGVSLMVGFTIPVFSIQCFQCSSYEHPECADIGANETASPFLHKCEPRDNYQMFCRKIVQKILDAPNFTRTTRTCGWYVYKTNESLCRKSDTDFKLETSCQCFTDACNQARTTVPTMAILGTFVFMLVAMAFS